MRRSLAIAVLVLASATASAETLENILSRNLTARGGADKLRALKTLRLTGRARFGGGDFVLEAPWASVQKRPGMFRSELTLQGLTQVSAYDGKRGWNVNPFGGRRDAEEASEDDARSLAQAAEIGGPLIDWRDKGYTVEYLGTEDVDGTPAHKLRVIRKDGDIEYVFLDPDSMLEIRTTVIHKVRGAEEITETDLGGYQQVGGVWLPFSLESGGKGGPRGFRLTIDRAELDVPVDDALFALPKPGQQVTRQIVAGAPDKTAATAAPPLPTGPAALDAGTISGISARNIGSATMSGRIAAVTAVNENGKTIVYIGSASGGVWKSIDGGTTFKPVFDKQPVQSIGAITVDPSNPKTIWVGTGESWTRNSVSVGNGIYRSTDEGETWSYMGLPESERISRILVHPKNSAIVYACVPGKLWSDSKDRGLYRTSDGGKTWTLVLPGDNLSTGCSSVTMDPGNPDVLLAGMWDFRRKGWTFRSGGDGPDAQSASSLQMTSDGGKTWKRLASNSARGLPGGPWGRVEVVYAPSNRKIVYAFIESKDSALYRSDDGGATWQMRDKSQSMVWRPFYFARLVVDPQNPNRVFKPDINLIVSEDGGRSFASSGGGAHGDWHDVWIDPANPKHIIGGDDGGLWLSYDGGIRWNKNNNLPISQFYHVSVDNKDPYQIYGGLQDNSNWVADSAYGGGISNSRWENIGGGDGFWVIVDPSDPNAVYCESQGGYITRVDRKTMVARDIQPKAGYKEKLRFNWNTPIHASPTQKNTIYMGGQFLFRSRDRGDSWQRISPDLTTNDPEKQKQEQSGGVTVDNSSAEMHTSIYSISESPKNASVIWVGTDDGNVQVTQNAGGKWTNVVGNVPDLPKNSWVSWVEASRFDAGTAYAAFDRHTFGDLTPWVYKTTDYGKTWKRIVAPAQGVTGYAHVIREDSVEKNLLFVGTEFGLWISTDGGATWARFQGSDFPAVAVRDLVVQPRESDLVIATHGRGIWIIDDITPLRALSAQTLAKQTAFLPGRPVQQRMSLTGGWVEGDAQFVGPNPPSGAVLTYYLRSRHMFGPIKLEVLDAAGKVVDEITPTKRRGINRVTWNMRVKGPRVPRAAQVAFSASQGPRVLPGTYTVRLTRGAEVIETKLAIGLDRRAPYDAAGRKAQYDAVMKAHALFDEMSVLVDKIQALHDAAADRRAKLPATDEVAKKLAALSGKLEDARTLIVATKEGGAITGEERIREHLDTLYGAINGWEGRPAKYQLDGIEALRRELDDARKAFMTVATADARALDKDLEGKKLEKLPQVTELAPKQSLDGVALECIESQGRHCGGDEQATATHEQGERD
jgi:photosystem II stability/assembly factor-like uncharacterized protein